MLAAMRRVEPIKPLLWRIKTILCRKKARHASLAARLPARMLLVTLAGRVLWLLEFVRRDNCAHPRTSNWLKQVQLKGRKSWLVIYSNRAITSSFPVLHCRAQVAWRYHSTIPEPTV